jgi:hypothetical protein
MTQYQRSYQIDYFCGWRYLLSPKFRNQARAKWGRNLLLRSLFLLGGFSSILITSTATVLLAMAVWNLLSYS